MQHLNSAINQLIDTALTAGNRLKKLPFPNDRAMGGMLICHAEDARDYGQWPSLDDRRNNGDDLCD